MMLNGKEITDEEFRYRYRHMSSAQRENVLNAIVAERKAKAMIRWERETDPLRKEQMMNMIAMGNYNFDQIFGPYNYR